MSGDMKGISSPLGVAKALMGCTESVDPVAVLESLAEAIEVPPRRGDRHHVTDGSPCWCNPGTTGGSDRAAPVAEGDIVTAVFPGACPCGCGATGERRGVVMEIVNSEARVAVPDPGGETWQVYGCPLPNVSGAS